MARWTWSNNSYRELKHSLLRANNHCKWEPVLSWIFIKNILLICNHDHGNLLILLKDHQTLLLHVELSSIQQRGKRNKTNLNSDGWALLWRKHYEHGTICNNERNWPILIQWQRLQFLQRPSSPPHMPHALGSPGLQCFLLNWYLYYVIILETKRNAIYLHPCQWGSVRSEQCSSQPATSLQKVWLSSTW